MTNQSSKTEIPLDAQFFQLLMAHQKKFHAYILASLQNYNDAQDVMQETTTILWRKFSEFDPDTDFVAWGLTIAKFQILRHLKTRSRSKLCFNSDIMEAISKETSNQIGQIDDRLLALRQCRNKLNERDQTLLKWRFDENISIQQIAEKSGRTLQAIYKNFSRIQQALMNCIDTAIARKKVSE